MVSTRASRTTAPETKTTKATKNTKPSEGLKAPARRVGRPKKTVQTATVEEIAAPVHDSEVQKPRSTTHSTRTRTKASTETPCQTRENVEAASEEKKLEASQAAIVPAAPKRSTRTRATTVDAEPVKGEALDESTKSRATRSTASARAKQAAVRNVSASKSGATKAAAINPKKAPAVSKRSTRKRVETSETENALFVAESVLNGGTDMSREEEKLLGEVKDDELPEQEQEMETCEKNVEAKVPEAIDHVQGDKVDDQTNIEGVEEPEASPKVAAKAASDEESPVKQTPSSQTSSDSTRNTPKTERVAVPSVVNLADQNDIVNTINASKFIPALQTLQSPFRSSSIVAPGSSIGSPMRGKAAAPKLLLSPAKNRFGDWLKKSTADINSNKKAPAVFTPMTPPAQATLPISHEMQQILNTCPSRLIEPSQSCLRGTKRRALDDVLDPSPKKSVKFTHDTIIETPLKVIAEQIPVFEDVAMTLGTPFSAAFAAAPRMPSMATPFARRNQATPRSAASRGLRTPKLLGTPFKDLNKTPTLATPFHALETPKLVTPGTVHWTWNPVTPALAVPAVTPRQSSPVVLPDEGHSIPDAPAATNQALKSTLLNGVNCYVEVRRPNGSDGSQYFSPLLRELGAKVSTAFSDDVTHVLWGNGNLATLERASLSDGRVKAVNLSWPMDCEKECIRLDEEPYLVDFSIYGLRPIATPKTVAKTPRALATLSTNATPISTIKPLKLSTTSPSKKTTSMIGANGSLVIKTPAFKASQMATFNPFTFGGQENLDYAAETIDSSPLTQRKGDDACTPAREKLLTMTCPPKQIGRPLRFAEKSPVRGGKVQKRRRLSHGN